MLTAKIFQNGRSQAVRLPKECRLEGKDVYVRKFDDIVILVPKTDDKWKALFASLDMFSDDFMSKRDQSKVQQERELF